MSARDLAATALVARAQRGLRASQNRRGERDAEIIRDLAVEGLQAMDDIAVELRRVVALERQAADALSNLDGMARRIEADEASHCRAERRAVAAEALAEHYRGGLANVLASAGVPEYVRENVEHYLALAAAGADTP